jgi:hypothetical protein
MRKYALVVIWGILLYSHCFGAMHGATVTASIYEKNSSWCKDSTCAPWHTIDGDSTDASSWRAEGQGVWIQYDLGTVRKLDTLKLVFTKGQTRSYFFGVKVSVDSTVWRTIIEKNTSSGKTAGWERFTLGGVNARYVRIIGYGNTNEKFSNWININEVDLPPSAP